MSLQLDPELVSHLLAKQIVGKGEHAKVAELAGAVSEVELQTQILGASFIKVHLVDPGLAIINSGLIQQEEGILKEVEVEFPEKSGWLWRLVAVEVSTDFTQPNLVLTFEDKIVAELRARRGQKTAPAGSSAPRFIHSLVAEVKPAIRFVCPALGQKISVKELSSAPKTRPAENQALASANKSKSTGKLTPDQFTFAGDLASATGLDGRVVAAWCLAEESGSAATGRESANNNNWLNIGYFDSGPGQIAFNSAFKTPEGGAKQTARFLKGEWGGASAGIIAILKSKSSDPAAQIRAIATSGWASSGYNGGSTLTALYNEISPSETPTGEGEASGTASESTGQLARGSTQNPSEDSWEACTRLAKAKNWFFFTDGNTAFLMDGPQLVHQKPVLHANIELNRIKRYGHRGEVIHESDVIQTPVTGTQDNTTLEYQSTHKVHGRVSRRSKISKPTTPAEIRLNLICDVKAFRAGDVFMIEGLGPFNGPWIVSDATRNCLKDTYTQFILQPPLEPIQGKEAGAGGSEAGTHGAAAEMAEKSLAEKSKYEYVYGGGRQPGADLFGPAPRTMDCSSWTTLCYKAAKLPDPSGLNYNPIGTTETLINNATKVSTPERGDLCLFGVIGHTTHVTIYVGGGEAISMGQPGDPEKGPAATTGPSGFLGYYRPKT